MVSVHASQQEDCWFRVFQGLSVWSLHDHGGFTPCSPVYSDIVSRLIGSKLYIGMSMGVNDCLLLDVALWSANDFFRMHTASGPRPAGTGTSPLWPKKRDMQYEWWLYKLHSKRGTCLNRALYHSLSVSRLLQ